MTEINEMNEINNLTLSSSSSSSSLLPSSSKSNYSSLSECIKQKKIQNKKLSSLSSNNNNNNNEVKEDNIQILYNPNKIEIERQPEHITIEDIPKFFISDKNALNYFHENGFVIFKEVATNDEINYSIDLFWKFVEENTEMKRNDVSTWTDSNFRRIGSPQTGILAGSGFGQSDFLWSLRIIPNVSLAFNLLYDKQPNDQLITSFDGGAMFRPWHHPDLISNCTQSGWFHVDQGRTLRGLQCIQGMLTLTDVDERTGGLCLIPKSHLYHDELVNSIYREGNYIPIPAKFHVLNHPQILPRCSKGDMICWDSRLIHCSTPAIIPPIENTLPISEPLRLAGYISMTPREWSTDDIINHRIQAYCRNITTSHWSHILTYTIPTNEISYPIKRNIENADERIRKLIGL